MALRITVNSSRVLRVEKIPPRFFLTRTRDSLSTWFGEKFWGERICLIPWSKSNNLPSVLHGRRKSRIFVQLGSESRILPPANARIFTIRMRIEANLIALRQLTLSDENVSSPILLLRTSTHTHTHIYMHIFLSPLCSTSPRQTTKFQPQFRQVIDIIRLLDTRCIRWICMKGLTRKSWKSGGMPRRVRDGRETATNSHRNRSLLPVSISDGAREKERENTGWSSLSRPTLFTDDVIGTIMLKKEVVSVEIGRIQFSSGRHWRRSTKEFGSRFPIFPRFFPVMERSFKTIEKSRIFYFAVRILASIWIHDLRWETERKGNIIGSTMSNKRGNFRDTLLSMSANTRLAVGQRFPGSSSILDA